MTSDFVALQRPSLVVTLLIVALICGCGSKEPIGEMTDDVTLAEVEPHAEKMHCTIPSGATVLGLWTQQVPTESVRLKLEMNERDLQSLLDNSPFKGKALTGADSAAFGPNVQWWDPGKVEMIQIGHMPIDGRSSEVNLGVAKSENGKLLVYLVWVDAQAEE